MAVLKPRRRLVYFRISEDEFQQIQQLCAVTGARSISEMARSAVQKHIDECKRDSANDEWKQARQSLDGVVSDLRAIVTQLTALASIHSAEPTQSVVRTDPAQSH